MILNDWRPEDMRYEDTRYEDKRYEDMRCEDMRYEDTRYEDMRYDDMRCEDTDYKKEDFRILCAMLDNYLSSAIGGKEKREKYDQYNLLDTMNYVIIAYD
ncbi:MAG TPA: hypothetical protein VJ888_07820, partial [Mobilitalea sp.]|nr:hypothetical protein [Mobilitalea sp.]